MVALSTSSRAFRLSFAEITIQGASGRWVRSSISAIARSYCGAFARFRQSSGPSL